jgi:hypothetical protein
MVVSIQQLLQIPPLQVHHTDNGNMIFIFDRKTKNEWLSLLILNRTL